MKYFFTLVSCLLLQFGNAQCVQPNFGFESHLQVFTSPEKPQVSERQGIWLNLMPTEVHHQWMDESATKTVTSVENWTWNKELYAWQTFSTDKLWRFRVYYKVSDCSFQSFEETPSGGDSVSCFYFTQ